MKKRVLVVDDSAFMRKLISDFISASEEMEVVGIARNGEDALVKIKNLSPDVITLDVEMPKMNGIEALKKIMSECPVPVVMLSSTTKEGAEETIKAVQYGAVDFIAKPSGTISLDLHKIQEEIVRKVYTASLVPITKLLGQPSPTVVSPNRKVNHEEIDESALECKTARPMQDIQKPGLIMIGTSTGGPRALQHVLTNLPSSLDAPVAIVQHMPPGFTKSLADRLNSLAVITVKEAEHGELLEKGTAYIAPGGFHMRIMNEESNLMVHLTKEEPPRNGHRPSVDVLFESASTLGSCKKVAVVMTGMGSDGTEGLMKLKETGNVTAIAESHETCIVYGMPKSVIAAKLADEVVNVEGIGQSIMKYMG
ncbi:protein-glutamate methylesterase/protein-glutamine glutaminase [Rossellomorea aquimaris]|uniref:Protein-glutamate methylesterase/protein-glutamine glutaminase n=1 Tax=Rossellomorea aquimaris TaxID=189382 RepID=A0A1J6WK58_9BACI|nr:chemotaxis response regulator protein-glutamate methylesterase [Rossellomorea aquimaris]OIU72208.1 chemotaxis response regulator protein-glutamate methylesterase [Rossellomorea aquimaris]